MLALLVFSYLYYIEDFVVLPPLIPACLWRGVTLFW